MNNDKEKLISSTKSSKIMELDVKIDNTKKTMVENIHDILENGESVTNIKNQSDELVLGSIKFKKGAKKLNWKLWWENQKMKFILVFGILIFLLILILIIVGESGGFKK
jgi:flagellar biosynthesis/type III secretory pathway M-ring protein FliF/YscJ